MENDSCKKNETGVNNKTKRKTKKKYLTPFSSPRVDTLSCTGVIENDGWTNNPTSMTVPNTANPVDGGNINNTAGSYNRWSYAESDMGDYDTVNQGRGPHWHSTSASQAHEEYHWNTDWMTESVNGTSGGNWSSTEIILEGYKVSIMTYLTESDAKTALTAQFNTRFTQFVTDTVNNFNSRVLGEGPGLGFGSYAAGQSVLDGYIAAIETYRLSKGW